MDVDIWLRGENIATTRRLAGIERDAATWTDVDVRAVLEGMLDAMYRLKHPTQESGPIALRGLSWIVNPYEEGGVLIAIEISMGAAVCGPFAIDKTVLENMIARVLAAPTSPTVH
ncbi:MAG: hypothetical protein FJW27_12390 [Acidimicrobiia bacterium]|nr:hypothetical protein [Acidimicrobiia bacterium]